MVHPFQHRSGFTLLELLIVLAIAATLSSLALVAMSRARANAQQLKCASNLRQIGTAINGYIADHDGRLPGPVFGGQPAYYSPWPNDGFLPTFLAPYLGLPLDPKHYPAKAEVFLCPAWKAAVPPEYDKAYSRLYVMQNAAHFRDGTTGFPFGYPKIGNNPMTEPVKINMIESLPQTAVMWDLDHYDIGGFSVQTPVHSGKRNYLYFDGHVELLPPEH